MSRKYGLTTITSHLRFLRLKLEDYHSSLPATQESLPEQSPLLSTGSSATMVTPIGHATLKEGYRGRRLGLSRPT